MDHDFLEVDVFASAPFSGNPVAVIADADELSDVTMRAIARWTNFSETTFLLTPTDERADYRVRIFTPDEEFPFAGHPTLGTARAWRALHNTPRQKGTIVQECGIGLVTIREESLSLESQVFPTHCKKNEHTGIITITDDRTAMWIGGRADIRVHGKIKA